MTWAVAPRRKLAETYPAMYSQDDPLDLRGKQPVFDAMHVEWMDFPLEQQRQVIINALRATMISPRLNLRNNAIVYQHVMEIPATEDDPDVFEQHIRQVKRQLDTFGQGDLLGDVDAMPFHPNVNQKLTPGFWSNIRQLANLGPYAEYLRQLAIKDMQQGGTGHLWRDALLKLNIPGIGAKVASFSWLALAPRQSDLGTMDVWMMRALGYPELEGPKSQAHYFQLEDELRQQKNQSYGESLPLGQFQWGLWDKVRTPGYHQDHSALRVFDPTPYNQVSWPASVNPRTPPARPQTPAEWEPLFSKTEDGRVINWQAGLHKLMYAQT